MVQTTKNYTTPQKIWRTILAIIAPVAVGGISAALTMNNMAIFGELNQPPLSPPAWLFPVAWTILYILMGIASYLIFYGGYIKDPSTGRKPTLAKKTLAKQALIIYGVQLAFNFLWSIFFFNLKAYYFAFAWLMIMWLLIVSLMAKAKKLHPAAFWCLAPYILWCTFAAYLNLSIAILN